MSSPMFPPSGLPVIAHYDMDTKTVLLPAHVRALPWEQQRAWGKKRGMELVRPVGGGAYSMFEMMQPFSSTDDVTLTGGTIEGAVTNDEYLTLPANFFSFPGKVAWFHAMGKMSNVVSTPGTTAFRVRYSTPVAGGGVAGTSLQLSGTIALNPVAVTDNLWFFDFYVKALSVGKTATSLSLLAWGQVNLANSAVAANDIRSGFMPTSGTALANVTSLDGTVAKALTLCVTPSLASQAWTVRDAWIVALN